MAWRSAIGQTWDRWSVAVKRELLREPDRILIDCGPDRCAPQTKKAAAQEETADLADC
jgi:hypothetical protein